MLSARIIAIILGYVCGLFPTGKLMAKKNHVDLSKVGSGSVGMTNSMRAMGAKKGALVLVGDLLKAVIPAVIIWVTYKAQYPDAVKLLMFYAAFGAVLGHDFPVHSHFKGGKGISSSVGLCFACEWRAAILCGISFFATVIPTKYVSLGSLTMNVIFVIQIFFFGYKGWLHVGPEYVTEFCILSVILCVLAFIQHRSNIKRLLNGTENKFSTKK